MKKILFIIILIVLSNSSLSKVNKTHGSLNLEKKQSKLQINISNKNDIITLLGPPSTKSQFDNNKWFYIERKVTNTSITTFGREKLIKNNVLVLKINESGLLASKKFLNMDKMEELKFTENSTDINYQNKNFLYNFFNSIRQKINEPVKKAIAKNKKN